MASTTPGVLLPVVPSPPLQNQGLNRFIQQWLVSLIGIDPTLMRPAWQPEPSNIPAAAVAWGAFRISKTSSDTFPAFVHDGTNNGRDQLQRHELLDVLVSMYDLGTNGQADFYAAMLRDGMAVAQNREVLTTAGMNLLAVGDLTTVPSLLKQRWLYRVDLSLQLARIVTRTYDVLNVESLDGDLLTDAGLSPYPVKQGAKP